MCKLFLLLLVCAAFAFAYAAPGLSGLSGLSSHGPILTWPHAVHVVRPIWTPHTIVRPIIHSHVGHNGYGYGHGWL